MPDLKEVRGWVGTGFWAITDQGLFSISNFAINILLARCLPPAQYGAFAVALAVLLLIGTVHTALLTEPMLVYGQGRYKDRHGVYLGTLVAAHAVFAVVTSLVLGLAGVVLAQLGMAALARAFLGLALAGSFILLPWLLRRACYVRFEPRIAALAGGLNLAIIAACATVLIVRGWFTLLSGFATLGLAGAVVGLWLVVRLRAASPFAADAADMWQILGQHWTYSRWALLGSLLSWVPTNLYFLVLPTRGGLPASAQLRVLMTFLMPVLQTHTALGQLLMPTFVRLKSRPEYRQRVGLLLAFFIVLGVTYWVGVGVLRRPLVSWVYGRRYAAAADLLWILGFLPVLSGATTVLGGIIRSEERPDWIFLAYCAASLATITLGVGLVMVRGLVGAVLGILVSYTILLMVLGWIVARWIPGLGLLRGRKRPVRSLTPTAELGV